MTESTRTITGGAALTLAALLLAACSGAGASGSGPVAEATLAPTASPTVAPTPAPTPSPTPEPTATPEPTPDLAAIGSAYLAIADIFTAKGQPAVDAIAAGGTFTNDEWGDMHQTVVDVYDEVLVEIDKVEFPDDLADEVGVLRAHFVDARDLFAEVAEDPSLDNWDEFVETATAYGKVGDAIRAYLGLPPRPTPPPD
jgi:hypothetical protein